jgi:elongation factor Ts
MSDMSKVTPDLVKKLRERTDAGIMDCKRFLVKTDGDIELAIIEMRKEGKAKADKKSDRIAAEGVIVIAVSEDKKDALMLEVNSETDFVARDSNFTEFSRRVAQTALQKSSINDVTILSNETLVETNHTIEQARQELVAKIGEHIQLRRIQRIHSDGCVASYLHGQRIGVLVALNIQDEILAKDIAMHIAASNPMVIDSSAVPADAIERERDIFTAQAKESGKPQEIIEKMIEGRISKFKEEVSLMDQFFVKDPSKKIKQLLQEKNATVIAFSRYEVGEGIEKKKDNFVEEVMSQARG